MRKVLIATAGMFIAGAGVLTLAAPAFAADTPVTVQITGGDLAISAPATSVSLGTKAGSSDAQSITGQLGVVLVSDQRAGIAGWVATAGSTNFTGSATGSTPISAATVTYLPGTAFVVGTATVAPTSLTAMTTPGTVQTATAVVGVNTATWNPGIGVPIPAGAVAGTYSATITHSVSLARRAESGRRVRSIENAEYGRR
jgi:hypothetical protein